MHSGKSNDSEAVPAQAGMAFLSLFRPLVLRSDYLRRAQVFSPQWICERDFMLPVLAPIFLRRVLST